VYYVVGTNNQSPNETVVSATPDTVFRWDATNQQWIYNLSTKNLTPNSTQQVHIALNDGTSIDFQFKLK
jgi:frataxin-like iron-binding protein CyaY